MGGEVGLEIGLGESEARGVREEITGVEVEGDTEGVEQDGESPGPLWQSLGV